MIERSAKGSIVIDCHGFTPYKYIAPGDTFYLGVKALLVTLSNTCQPCTETK